MSSEVFQKKAQDLLDLADIKINGSRPWDIQIHNQDFYKRVLTQGSMGLGESYMDGWWDVEALDVFFFKIFEAGLQEKVKPASVFLKTLAASLMNAQTKIRSKKVAEEHYNLGNDFYKDMLDPLMQYTCGYWRDADNLNDAQEAKLDLICKKLQLQQGEKVVELGSGWGGFGHFAASRYGADVTSYNISEEQVKFANEWNKDLSARTVLSDYRDATGTFDKVASIGMCEHVGYKNYRSFMQLAHTLLKDGGIFLLHTIGGNISVKTTDPWIDKYIFPNSMLPSVAQLSKAAEGLFVMEDWHNLNVSYDKTLMAWDKNFRDNWSKHKDAYGERFYKMWRFYLMTSAAQFRARRIQLWQITLSKGGVKGGYESVR